jgi:7-keto-8-aminopelargonate synthetase-like enzyme
VTARFLVNSARTLHHSTAPPPVAIAAAMAALELLESEPRRVEKLLANAEVLRAELAREGFEVAGASTHVIPLLIGEAEPAAHIVEYALEQGVFTEAVLPPGVPDGAARVRLAVMASHTRAELRDAARAVARAALRAGVRPGANGPVALAHYDDLAEAA